METVGLGVKKEEDKKTATDSELKKELKAVKTENTKLKKANEELKQKNEELEAENKKLLEEDTEEDLNKNPDED